MSGSIPVKTDGEIRLMRDAGKILARILKELGSVIRAGISTRTIEQEAQSRMKKYKVQSAFKGYHGFPASICVSVNEEVIHGIPREDKVLKEGDMVSLDVGIIKQGYFVDAAYTYQIGKVEERLNHLGQTAQEALAEGIAQFRTGNRLGDISAAIEQTVVKEGYSVVREFVGHGIGRNLHEEPPIPNFGIAHEGALLKEGMVFAIEPMVNEGESQVRVLEDGWTAVTADHKVSVHFEHTVALTAAGPLILTAA